MGRTLRNTARWLAAGAGVAVGTYATTAGLAYARYGRPTPSRPEEEDALLDRFLPRYDIVERHHVRVAAPAAVTLAAAGETDLQQAALVRAIFRAREVLLGAEPDTGSHPRGLLAQVTELGWRVLEEEPGREVVMGAVTQPWMANVVFRGLEPEAFAAFNEPDFVKIAWTLRADPIDGDTSIFRTETRAVATDANAREKFRRYWSLVSPGIWLIRWLSLGPIRCEAERRAVARLKSG